MATKSGSVLYGPCGVGRLGWLAILQRRSVRRRASVLVPGFYNCYPQLLEPFGFRHWEKERILAAKHSVHLLHNGVWAEGLGAGLRIENPEYQCCIGFVQGWGSKCTISLLSSLCATAICRVWHLFNQVCVVLQSAAFQKYRARKPARGLARDIFRIAAPTLSFALLDFLSKRRPTTPQQSTESDSWLRHPPYNNHISDAYQNYNYSIRGLL